MRAHVWHAIEAPSISWVKTGSSLGSGTLVRLMTAKEIVVLSPVSRWSGGAATAAMAIEWDARDR